MGNPVGGAILPPQVAEEARGVSQFINDAVMAEVERLESKYNEGATQNDALKLPLQFLVPSARGDAVH